MDEIANLKHWEEWANQYGTELRATTKCMSIKRLEIEALLRAIVKHQPAPSPLVLEVGCGNGVNGFALAERQPAMAYVGLDFSPRMISNAVAVAERQRAEGSGDVAARLAFGVADSRDLDIPLMLDEARPHSAGAIVAGRLPSEGFDIVFTDRVLINLRSAEEQLAVMVRIQHVLRPGGLFLMLENSRQTHATLNSIRDRLGLPPRPSAEFNLFIDEDSVVRRFSDVMQLLEVDDFSSLHDLVLYAVEPAAGDGEVHYDSPLMTRLSDAVLALQQLGFDDFGSFGQNRLWVWQK